MMKIIPDRVVECLWDERLKKDLIQILTIDGTDIEEIKNKHITSSMKRMLMKVNTALALIAAYICRPETITEEELTEFLNNNRDLLMDRLRRIVPAEDFAEELDKKLPG